MAITEHERQALIESRRKRLGKLIAMDAPPYCIRMECKLLLQSYMKAETEWDLIWELFCDALVRKMKSFVFGTRVRIYLLRGMTEDAAMERACLPIRRAK